MNKRFHVGALAGVIGLASSAGHAISLHIESQAMDGALREFARQSGLQLLYSAENVSPGIVSARVDGDVSVERGLAQLLGGSGLAFEFLNDRTAVVRIQGQAVPQANFDEHSHRIHNGIYLVADDSDSGGPAMSSEALSDRQDTDRRAIPEILVRGSRSLNTDIRRTEDDIQPYVVMKRDEIARAQAMNLEDLFKSHLPMNAASISLDQTADAANLTAGGINLRGLGTNQTLILVDGRRLPSVSLETGDLGQPDISGIPLSSIERIEVLPATASGIYGGSATGGVVNIIRKKDYSGLDLQAQYGNTFDRELSSVLFSASGGATFEHGKSNISFTASHSKSGMLLVADRDFLRNARDRVTQNAPSQFTALSGAPTSATANICSARAITSTIALCTTTPLVLDNGQPLGSSVTYVPEGYAGAASDAGVALATNAGRYNSKPPYDNRALLRAPERNALGLSLQRKFGEMFDVYLDTSGNRSVSDLSSSGSTTQNVVLRANDAANPFRQDVRVTVDIPSARRPGWSKNENLQAAGGVVVRLPKDWAASLERNWSRSRFEYKQTVFGGTASTDVVNTIKSNPLADLNSYLLNLKSSDFSPYFDFSGGPFDTVLNGTDLRLSGPALSLPAGPVSLSALLERRDEAADDAITNSTVSHQSTFYPRRQQDVSSAYLEARVPIIGQSQGFSLARTLEMQASVRRDKYKSVTTSTHPTAQSPDGPFASVAYSTNRVSSTDYTVGVRYEPVKYLTFRASTGTGFLPPALSQLTPLPLTGTSSVGVSDPRRGGTDTYVGKPFNYVVGGNDQLDPEKSRSWSAGLIFIVPAIEGARLSIDYTEIKKSGEIYSPTLFFIVQNEALFPNRIQRGTNLPGDQAGWAGPITEIDSSAINLSSTVVRSYDIRADYELGFRRLGSFRFSAAASELKGLSRQLTATSDATDSVGFRDGPLRWRGTASLNWSRGPLSITWDAQYYNSYSVQYADPASATRYNSALVLAQGSSSIAPQTYHDLWMQYRFGNTNAVLENFTVSMSIQNVFNKMPPLVLPTTSTLTDDGPYGYSTYGDPRLRRYFLTIQKRF